jgi:hypothetical protein
VHQVSQPVLQCHIKKDTRGDARAAADVVLRTLNVDPRLRVSCGRSESVD